MKRTAGERLLMQISDFAAASQLSVRMLRYYHETGLLEPAYVDPSTGYRYYAASQLSRAAAIALLRNAEMPLAEIGELLTGDVPAALQALSRHRRRLTQARAVIDRSLAVVQRLIEEDWTMDLAIVDRHLDPITVVTTRVEGPRSFSEPLLTSAFSKLSRAVRAAGVQLPAPLQLVYSGDEDHFVQDACFPVPPDTKIDGYDTVHLPAVDVASAEHTGPSDTLAPVFGAIVESLTSRGHRAQFPIRTEILAAPPLLGDGEPGMMTFRIDVPYV